MPRTAAIGKATDFGCRLVLAGDEEVVRFRAGHNGLREAVIVLSTLSIGRLRMLRKGTGLGS
jgi:hypothetical protein